MTGSPFSLFRRKESGVWYVRFRLPDRSWSNARTTRCYKKREAIAFAEEHLRTNGAPQRKGRVRFSQFAEGFFDTGGRWETRAQKRGVRGAHVRNQQARLENYLIPVFGSWYLDEIGPEEIESALDYIQNEVTPKRKTKTGKLSNRTINGLHAALSAVFAEAVRRRYINVNPMTEVERLPDTSAKRGILTTEEVVALLHPDTALEVWRHPRYWLIFRIGISTAARSGEIRTLHREDVFPDHLVVRRSWDDVDGLTDDTKTRTTRTVPLHENLYRDLTAWAEKTGVSGGYLFPSPTIPGAPIDRDSVLKNFRASLERAGIDAEAQDRRNLCFHSLRHSAATHAMRKGVNRQLVKQMTGHASDRVFDRYLDHTEGTDWEAIADWQDELLSS